VCKHHLPIVTEKNLCFQPGAGNGSYKKTGTLPIQYKRVGCGAKVRRDRYGWTWGGRPASENGCPSPRGEEQLEKAAKGKGREAMMKRKRGNTPFGREQQLEAVRRLKQTPCTGLTKEKTKEDGS